MKTNELDERLKNIKIFKGTFARDKMPQIKTRPSGFVINTDSSAEPGEHWVAILLLNNGRGEYFDSFGLPPLHKDFIIYLNQQCPEGWIWNNIALQDPDDVTCGNFCEKYIKARSLKKSLPDFLLAHPQLIVQNHH